MTLGWSRSCYVELVRRADTAFIQCHVNAFEYLGGVPQRCLYDNAKVVTLGRDEAGRVDWNRRTLDFAMRVGFEIRLCQPYRVQTKAKIESGVKYARRNMWPSIRFTDDADLNRQALQWCDVVANVRVHGTARRVPWGMRGEERPHPIQLPHMAPPKTPQEGAQGGWRLDPAPQHLPGFASPQRVGIINAVTTGQCRCHQGPQLISRIGATWRIPQVNMMAHQLDQSQMMGQNDRQDPSGIGYQTMIIEGDLDAVSVVAW